MQDNSITHYSFFSHEKDNLIIRHVTLRTVGLCSGPSGDYRQQHDASAADQCQTMGLGKGWFDCLAYVHGGNERTKAQHYHQSNAQHGAQQIPY